MCQTVFPFTPFLFSSPSSYLLSLIHSHFCKLSRKSDLFLSLARLSPILYFSHSIRLYIRPCQETIKLVSFAAFIHLSNFIFVLIFIYIFFCLIECEYEPLDSTTMYACVCIFEYLELLKVYLDGISSL